MRLWALLVPLLLLASALALPRLEVAGRAVKVSNAAYEYVELRGCPRVRLTNVTVEHGIRIYNCTDVELVNVKVLIAAVGLDIGDSKNVTVANATVLNATWDGGLCIEGSTNIAVANVTVCFAGDDGLRIEDSENVSAVDVSAHRAGDDGLCICLSRNVSVSDLRVYGARVCVRLEDSSSVTVKYYACFGEAGAVVERGCANCRVWGP